MNLNSINKREVLSFDQFRDKVHDSDYKPLAPVNQSGDQTRSGISAIKREAAFDFAGYNDAVFAGRSNINYPGLNVRDPRTGKLTTFADLAGAEDAAGLAAGGGAEIGTELSESDNSFRLLRIFDF
jgi:hypothetical protein